MELLPAPPQLVFAPGTLLKDQALNLTLLLKAQALNLASLLKAQTLNLAPYPKPRP